MNGPRCPDCGEGLATTQRYCGNCGIEVTPIEYGRRPGRTRQQWHIIELVLVCLLACGSAIIGSTRSLFAGEGGASSREWGWAHQILAQSLSLAILWYVLQRRKKHFSDLGLRFSFKEVGFGLLLFVGGLFLSGLFRATVDAALTDRHSVAFNTRDVGNMLFGGHVSGLGFLSMFLNPFFEELIVRAYVMTVIKRLTNSASLAVVISVLLQTSYHFYQGIPQALGHVGPFLLFALYYAKTGRIWAPIIAHMIGDVLPTVLYMAKVHEW